MAKSQRMACQDVVYASWAQVWDTHTTLPISHMLSKHSLAVSGLQYRLDPVFFFLSPISASPTHSLVAP